ncbi:MAG: hypothetical protein ACPMAG_00195, partial [Limisphaerales bacterium]
MQNAYGNTDYDGISRLNLLLRRTREICAVETRGRVVQLIGLVIESEGPHAAIGELCLIESDGRDEPTFAEVVGFRNNRLLLMPLGEIHGIHPGSEVISTGKPLSIPVGESLKGRVINSLGKPIDGEGAILATEKI